MHSSVSERKRYVVELTGSGMHAVTQICYGQTIGILRIVQNLPDIHDIHCDIHALSANDQTISIIYGFFRIAHCSFV